MLAAEAAQFIDLPIGADAATVAQAGDADLIVLGIAEDRGIADSLRGTAAERIVQHSSCPALTVNRLAARGSTERTHEHQPALFA
jgi:nucleotide-binding universal stress UspA family protein